jgi:hypothetical protein
MTPDIRIPPDEAPTAWREPEPWILFCDAGAEARAVDDEVELDAPRVAEALAKGAGR